MRGNVQMSRLITGSVVAILLASGGLVAGCGGASKTSPPPSTAPSGAATTSSAQPLERVPCGHGLPGRRADPRRTLRFSDEPVDRIGKRGTVAGRDEQPRPLRLDQVEQAANGARHNGKPGGHGFNGGVRKGFRPRRQHEHVGVREQRGDIVTMPREADGLLEPARVHHRFEGSTSRTGTDEQELQVRMPIAQPRGGFDEHLVSFFLAQVRDGDHRPNAAPGGTRAELISLHTVRNNVDASRRHPFTHELLGGRGGIRDDLVSEPVRLSLQRNLRRALVGSQLPAAADPSRDAGERRRGQRKRIRVQVARLHDRQTPGPAPGRKCRRLCHRGRPGESADRKRCNRRARVRALAPRTFVVKAGDVDLEAASVQPLGQFDHLPFGPAGMEAGEEDRDRYLWRQLHRHQSQQAKCHATGPQQ
jgi:hypothetical protein